MLPASALHAMLQPGFVVAQRFTLQRLAGHGGMGVVFQARDEQSGLPVALKVLHAPGNTEAARRFTREAQVLATLRHPGIVSYVAHGLTQEGLPFLVMEWLEGEDLAQRLTHAPLSLFETLLLLRRTAAALAAAHAQGIIHRDLKPSNLFLRAGQPGDGVVLDFGLACFPDSPQQITGSAAVLGTPGYMAPEQASSVRELTASVDVFSLGCVLYECLTGQAPFRAPHLAAVLARILFAEPTPLRTVRPELPEALEALLARMLAKSPAHRFADAGHLLRALETLNLTEDLPPPALAVEPLPSTQTPAASRRPEPAHLERHVVSVLLAVPMRRLGEGAQSTSYHPQRLLQGLQAHGAHAALLADGSLLAAFVMERGAATDQAALAARCALSIQQGWPDSRVALTTGLSQRSLGLPVGEAVDRASELLQLQKSQSLDSAPQVLVDDTTAGLLGSEFQLEKACSGLFVLSAERLGVDASRPLLGRPTSCVGRDQELTLLEMALKSCVEDSCARALLITAPAGIGKSRLRHELLRRLERQAVPPLVLLGRGDPMHTSAAQALVGQAVRRACGVVDGAPLEERQAQLVRHLTRHLPAEQHLDVVGFLGELCAIPFPAGHSPKLRAAREDPQLMNSQVTRALVTWLKAECAQGLVLLMLEDLHWSDGPSIKLIEDVLKELSEQPLLVLALARPEVKELFPGLWSRWVQEVPLRALSQKACARLVHEVLGPQVPQAVVARLVGQAEGNALFLEELIRWRAEGRGEETPGSVLAMLQSRLQRLVPEARRVVLAASLFGRSFWAEGVRALLEPAMTPEELAHWLRHLVEQELIQLQPVSRFPAAAEYRFHHALVRDAAYSLVPERLLALGHCRAGEWLEAAGESEPLVLAEHAKLGGQKQKAVQLFTQACKHICERQRTDLQGAQRCLKAAFDCEPTGVALTELQALDVEIAFWMEDFSRAFAVSQEILPKLAEGSAPWVKVVGYLLVMNTEGERLQEAFALGERLMRIEPAPEVLAPYGEALAFLVAIYQWTCQRQEAQTVIARQAQVARLRPERDDFAYGWWCIGQGYFDYDFDPHPWRSRQRAEEGVAAFSRIGVERNELLLRTLLGQSLAALGERAKAVQVMHEGMAGAMNIARASGWLQMHMALVLSGSPEPEHQEEARRLALQPEEVAMNPLNKSTVPLVLARVALAQGLPVEAEAQARRACESLQRFMQHQIFARVCLSSALLAQGRALEARAEAREAVLTLERMGGGGVASVGVWLAMAEACQAQGDGPAADEALRHALECLRLRARDLPDETARERFVSQVPENARVMQWARQRWGESLSLS